MGPDCLAMDGPLCAVYGAESNEGFQAHLATTSINADMVAAGGFQKWIKGYTRVRQDSRVNPCLFVINELGRFYESRSREYPLLPSYGSYPFKWAAESLPIEDDVFSAPPAEST
jgi:hypothetical protein